MIRPPHLKKGDLIGLISPASSPKKEEVLKAIQFLKEQGFKVKLGRNYDKKEGYLAGSDQERVSDLHEMFSDSNVKAIWCTRGGYGSGRLSEWIDLELIRKNPKIFVGYSDITYLHVLFNHACNLVTFHGAMCQPELSQECIDVSTMDTVEVFLNQKEWLLPTKNARTIVSGRAEGQIIGGNLVVFMSTFGTKDEPNLDGKIVFFEDIGEDPYKIDRMLNQFYLSRKWENVSGFLLGSFKDCKPTTDHGITIQTVLDEYFKKMNKPTMCQLPIGHEVPNYLLPLNCPSEMNTWTKKIHVKNYLL